MIFFTPKCISMCACIYNRVINKKITQHSQKNKINPFPSGTNCL